MREVGPARPLPSGTGLAAFRIVQEALTNIIRHSTARSAELVLDWTSPHGLTVRVDDPGPAGSADAGGTGSGLVGMRERAAALGGTLEAGPRESGGFQVLAWLPEREGER